MDILLILLVTKLPLTTNEVKHYTNGEKSFLEVNKIEYYCLVSQRRICEDFSDHFSCMVHIRRAQASSLPSLGMTSQFHIQPRGNIFHFIRRHPTAPPTAHRVSQSQRQKPFEWITYYCRLSKTQHTGCDVILGHGGTRKGARNERERHASRPDLYLFLSFLLSLLCIFIDMFYLICLFPPFFFHTLFPLMTYVGYHILRYCVCFMLLKCDFKLY
jgi:hypothetical protein